MEELIPGKRLTVHVGEDTRLGGKPIYLAVMEIIKDCGIVGATAVRGIESVLYTDQTLHNINTEYLMTDLPIMVEAIDEVEKIDRAIERIIQLEDVSLVEALSVNFLIKRSGGEKDD